MSSHQVLPDISIIVPVYNAHRHLREALQSIVDQTLDYRLMEVLVVDDGSTDQSRSVAQAFTEVRANIRLLETGGTQSGAFAARNLGLQQATGTYVMFLDGDDQYMPNACRTLFEEAERESADVVGGTFVHLSEDHECEPNQLRKMRGMEFHCLDPAVSPEVFVPPQTHWSRMFRRGHLEAHSIKFPSVRRLQDVLFTLRATLCAKRVSYLDVPIVRYRRSYDENNPSLTQQRSTEMIAEVVRARQMIKELFDSYDQSGVYREVGFVSDLRDTLRLLSAARQLSRKDLSRIMALGSPFFSVAKDIDAATLTTAERTIALLVAENRIPEAAETLFLLREGVT